MNILTSVLQLVIKEKRRKKMYCNDKSPNGQEENTKKMPVEKKCGDEISYEIIRNSNKKEVSCCCCCVVL